jgi:hypothetical protein
LRPLLALALAAGLAGCTGYDYGYQEGYAYPSYDYGYGYDYPSYGYYPGYAYGPSIYSYNYYNYGPSYRGNVQRQGPSSGQGTAPPPASVQRIPPPPSGYGPRSTHGGAETYQQKPPCLTQNCRS